MGYQRRVPGTREVPGRAFLYLQHRAGASFLPTFRSLGEFIENNTDRYPTGGMITENVRITLPDGRVFYGISFKGDLERWAAGIRKYADVNGLSIAAVEGDQLVTDRHDSYALSESSIEFLTQP